MQRSQLGKPPSQRAFLFLQFAHANPYFRAGRSLFDLAGVPLVSSALEFVSDGEGAMSWAARASAAAEQRKDRVRCWRSKFGGGGCRQALWGIPCGTKSGVRGNVERLIRGGAKGRSNFAEIR